MTNFIELGHFKPVIDHIYLLDGIAKAFNHTLSGQKIGNVVVAIT